MKVNEYKGRVKHIIYAYNLPKRLKDELYELALDNEYSMFDVEDGDFKFEVDLTSTDKSIIELKNLLDENIIKENSLGIEFNC